MLLASGGSPTFGVCADAGATAQANKAQQTRRRIARTKVSSRPFITAPHRMIIWLRASRNLLPLPAGERDGLRGGTTAVLSRRSRSPHTILALGEDRPLPTGEVRSVPHR